RCGCVSTSSRCGRSAYRSWYRQRHPPPPDQRRLVRWGRCVHCSVHASHVPGPFRRVSAAPARHRSTSPTARAVGPPSNPLRTVSSKQLKAMPAPAATSRNRMVVRESISEEDALERAVDRRGGDPDDDASGELMLGQPSVDSRVALADGALQRVEQCGSVPPGCGDQGTRSNASGRKNRKRSRRDRVVARLRSSVIVEDCSELLTSREIRVLARGELDVCLALGGGRSLEEQIGHLGG